MAAMDGGKSSGLTSAESEELSRLRRQVTVNMPDIGDKSGIQELTAASGYTQFSTQVASALQATDTVNWAFTSTPPLY